MDLYEEKEDRGLNAPIFRINMRLYHLTSYSFFYKLFNKSKRLALYKYDVRFPNKFVVFLLKKYAYITSDPREQSAIISSPGDNNKTLSIPGVELKAEMQSDGTPTGTERTAPREQTDPRSHPSYAP